MELKIVFENELSLDVLDKEFFAILFDQLLKIKEKNGTQACACQYTSKNISFALRC